jgi:transcriptional regulator with XRE-family HTH domain
VDPLFRGSYGGIGERVRARHRKVMAVLTEVRTRAGVTQRELARRLARAHSYVSRIEKGDRRLDVPEMIQWCEVLGADPVDVLKRIVRRG